MDGKRKRGRPRNTSDTKKCHPSISAEADWMLERLKQTGIYGRSKSEVAGRFIEQALQAIAYRRGFLAPPMPPAPLPLTTAPKPDARTEAKATPRRRRPGRA